MKRIIIIAFLLVSISGIAQIKVFDTIKFYRGGQVYKMLLYNDSMLLNNRWYYSFPGFGITHDKAAYGDHTHSGLGDSFWGLVSGSTSNIYNLNSGSIGVGTTNPNAKFAVITSGIPAISGYTTGNTAVMGYSTNSAGIQGTSLQNHGGYFSSTYGGYGIYTTSGSGAAIYAQAGTGPAGLFMGGNVGIGLTNPTYKLQVAGNIYAVVGAGNTAFTAVATSSGNGIFATAENGNGITATATGIGFGGQFTAASGTGVYASSDTRGLQGTSPGGMGVYGNTANGYAVFGNATTSGYAFYANRGKTWLDSLLYVRYLPWGTGSERMVVWDSTSREFKKRPMPEPAITASTTAKYFRGDKTFQTLDKTAVGLSNVENTALSTWSGSTNISLIGTIQSTLSVNDSTLRIIKPGTPGAANAKGAVGQICWDENFIYICYEDDKWKRVAITQDDW